MVRVSVITPVRATTEEDVLWLREAIESVRAQTYADWEMVIVNDGSTVTLSSLKDVISGDDRIRALKNAGSGVSTARNTAVENAVGELLLPLDHDDVLPPDAMQIMVDAWDGDGKDFGVVYGDVLSFGVDFERFLDMPIFSWGTLLRTLIMPIGSLHSKASWKDIGGWDPAFQKGLEDWEYWIRMAVNGYHGYHVQTVTYHYRRHGHGRLATLRTQEGAFSEQQAAIRTKYQDYYNGKEPKMCRGCGRAKLAFKPLGIPPKAPPGPAAFAAANVATGLVIVKYSGNRGASFGIVGRATGWKYNVPGGRGCIVEGPNGKPGVHPDDVQFFKNYDGGRTFTVD